MYITFSAPYAGLDMAASGRRIGELINNSGICDKELGRLMNISVQSINKWRHGRNLPDIENMFILSRILGVKVDDFLVPTLTGEYMLEIEHREFDGESSVRRLMAYAQKLSKTQLNYALNDITI